MDADFLDAVQGALDESIEIVGEKFTIAGKPVAGDFDGDGETLALSPTGGQEEKYGGILVISRTVLPDRPAVQSIIIGPDQTRYRIYSVDLDAVSWTLTLTHPNARHK